MNLQQSNRLILVDGSGYIFRAYYALPPMYRDDGTPVNAVFGFTKMLLKLVNDLKPEYIAVIFDAGRKTFRNDIYADYKANRGEPPEELIPQFDLVRQATKALNLPLCEISGYEADDVIATFAKAACNQGQDCLIVSSDKDLMQLVNEHVKLLDPIKNVIIGDEEVQQKFGVLPNRVVDVQALAGDSSDNVPGVPGIGIKTAAELINQYGNLEQLLANANNIKQPKRRDALVQFADQARISQQLVQLRTDVPVDMQTSELVHQSIDNVKLHSFLLQQQFKSLSTSIGFPEQSLDKPLDESKEEERMSLDTFRTETRAEIFSIDPEITKVDDSIFYLEALFDAIKLVSNIDKAISYLFKDGGKIKELENTIYSNSTNIQPLNVLNSHEELEKVDNNIVYDEWINSLIVTEEHLQTVFERNIIEGIKNNVYGTKLLIDFSIKYNIKNMPTLYQIGNF